MVLTLYPMETREQFTERLRLAGLQKQTLAKLLGLQASSISRYGASALMHHKPVPQYAETMIRAWTIMTPNQRAELLAGLNGDDT